MVLLQVAHLAKGLICRDAFLLTVVVKSNYLNTLNLSAWASLADIFLFLLSYHSLVFDGRYSCMWKPQETNRRSHFPHSGSLNEVLELYLHDFLFCMTLLPHDWLTGGGWPQISNGTSVPIKVASEFLIKPLILALNQQCAWLLASVLEKCGD